MIKGYKKVRNKHKILKNRPSYGLFRYMMLYNKFYLKVYVYYNNGKRITTYEAFHNLKKKLSKKVKYHNIKYKEGDIVVI